MLMENPFRMPTDDGEAGLLSFLEEALAEGVPLPLKKPEVVETVRSWSAREAASDVDPFRPLERHHALDFAFEDVPAAKPHRRRSNRGRGGKRAMNSVVMGRLVHAESSYEYAFFRWLELDTSALAFIEQPLSFHFTLNGKRALARPDALVLRPHGLELVEIKQEEAARQEEDRWEAIGTAAAAYGIGYRVVTDERLARGALKGNVKRVFDFRHHRPAREPAFATRDAVRGAGSLPLSDAMAVSGLETGHLLWMVRQGLLSIELEPGPIVSGTPLSWCDRCAVDPWRALA